VGRNSFFFPLFSNLFEIFSYFIQKKRVKFTGFFFSPKISQFFGQKVYEKLLKKKHWTDSSIFQHSIVIVIFISLNQKKTIPTCYSKFPTMKGQKEQGGKKKKPQRAEVVKKIHPLAGGKKKNFHGQTS